MVPLGRREPGGQVGVAQGRGQRVERWFRTVKDRPWLNCAFPRSPSGLERARTFIRLYAFYYNHIRPHHSLDAQPPLLTPGKTRTQRLQKVLEVKKPLS
ncbi:MAG: integrase core domain-containing protein [Candidatus Freyrarchaeum guaymaensis]